MSRVMNLLPIVILYGGPMSLSLFVLVMLMLWRNPRLLLQDYPEDVKATVPPKSPAERRTSVYCGIIFFLLVVAFPLAGALAARAGSRDFLEIFLAAFGVAFLFNVVDWLIIDWLIVCTVTPAFVVIPGTAGMAGYKNYGMHFRGFVVGCVLSVVLGFLIAIIVNQIPHS